jgi:hypothetical protein
MKLLGRGLLGCILVGLLANSVLASVTVELRPQSYDPNDPYWRFYGVTPGQSISVTFDIYVVVVGMDPNIDKKEGFQTGYMSLLSANSTVDPNKAVALGKLTGAKFSPFDGSSSSIGTQRDLDGDTDLDIGANSGTSGYYIARAAGMQYAAQTEVGNFAWEWKIGTVKFDGNSNTVLVKDANTVVYPRAYKATTAWTWYEDGNAKNAGNGTVIDGIANGITIYQKWAEANTGGPYRILQGGTLNLAGTGTATYSAITRSQWQLNSDPNVNPGEPNTPTGDVPFSVLQSLGAGTIGNHPLSLEVDAKDGSSASADGLLTVMAHADGSFSSTLEKKVLNINFGYVIQSPDSNISESFHIANLETVLGFTAGLDLLGAVETSDPNGKFYLDPTIQFANLPAGHVSSFFDVFLDISEEGSFSGSYTLNLSDEDVPGKEPQELTLNVRGWVVPEPGTLALVTLGAIGMIAKRRRARA